MLVIRFRRTGKKGQPYFRIVITDQRKSVYSPYIEMIGHYDPRTKALVLNKEKALEWMGKGAKPSNSVAKLLKQEEVKHKSVVVKKFRKVSKKELEAQKAEHEAEKAQEQAEKEAAKEAFEEKLEAEQAEKEAEKAAESAEPTESAESTESNESTPNESSESQTEDAANQNEQ